MVINLCRIRAAVKEDLPIVDVDGSYLYRKQLKANAMSTVNTAIIPTDVPLAGWESITAANCEEVAKKIPAVMPGMCYMKCVAM